MRNDYKCKFVVSIHGKTTQPKEEIGKAVIEKAREINKDTKDYGKNIKIQFASEMYFKPTTSKPYKLLISTLEEGNPQKYSMADYKSYIESNDGSSFTVIDEIPPFCSIVLEAEVGFEYDLMLGF